MRKRFKIYSITGVWVTLLLVTFIVSPLQAFDDVKITPELIQKLLEKEKRQSTSSDEQFLLQSDPAAPLIRKAIAYASHKKYQKASQILYQAVHQHPNSSLAFYNLAWVYSELKRWEKTLIFSQSALKLNPKLAGAYFLSGLALSNLKNYQQAIVFYRQAIYYNPHNSLYYNNLGNALLFLEQSAEAIMAYRKAIEIEPSNADYYNNLGEVLRHVKRYEEAIKAYHQAIERRPVFALAYANLSDSYVSLKQFESAKMALDSAVKLDPSHPEWHFNLGILALKFNDRNTAAKHLQALKKMPKNSLTDKLGKVFVEYDDSLNRLLLRKETDYIQALLKADSEALKRLLADNYILIAFKHTSNKSKELERSSLLIPGAAFESIKTDDIKIKAVGQEVLVKGQMMIQVIHNGETLCGTIAYERTYVYQDKFWRILKERVTPLYKKTDDCNSSNNYLDHLQAEKR